MRFASLIVLSYKRKEYLEKSLRSMQLNTRYPHQIIVMDDASDEETQTYLFAMMRAKKISHVLFNADHNQGIGVAMNRGFAIARGDIVMKLDTDLLYKPGWLTEVVRLLDTHPKIGCVGLFKYWHGSCVFTDELIKTHPDYHEVIDFVGSAVCFRTQLLQELGPWTETRRFAEDKDFKEKAIAAGYQMALPLEDIADNFGFGEQHTTLIAGYENGEPVWEFPDATPLLFGDIVPDV